MTKEEIIKPENLVYKKPTLMNDNPMHYCPGCSHGEIGRASCRERVSCDV